MALQYPLHYFFEQEGPFCSEDNKGSSYGLFSRLPRCFISFPSPATNLPLLKTTSTGANEYKAAGSFIRRKLLEQNTNQLRSIYTHFTCATDTNNIRVVFGAVRDIILSKVMASGGFAN
jgi:hypothetical protein